MTSSSDWTQWTGGAPPSAPGTSPAGSDATSPSPGGSSPAESGGDWTQWTGGGGKPPVPAGSSPFPYTVRCPIGLDSSAARVTLPTEAGQGATIVTDVGVEGSADGSLPSSRGYEVLDPATVLVHLTGSSDVATGPEYEPAPYPGGKKKAVPPPAGQPFVTVLVVPPPFEY
ncbi:hypothetical protein GCM10010269_50270 [Streptomyces humidus]|uniref:Uncharacterized protein n=1 Tax=Streptomyces humidus TaxID=52259 RepID=A0A918FYP0_9ACTN|nr:hypothetical protein GCM10010269_50270 [Streptomyces humidus]